MTTNCKGCNLNHLSNDYVQKCKKFLLENQRKLEMYNNDDNQVLGKRYSNCDVRDVCDDDENINEFDDKFIVEMTHRLHNAILLENVLFGPCPTNPDNTCEGWCAHNKRCECSDYKGFYLYFDNDIDWINDSCLETNQWLGHQGQAW